VVSGVDPGIGVLDRGQHPQGEGEVLGFFDSLVLMAFVSSFVREKCIRLMREMFMIFPFGQYMEMLY